MKGDAIFACADEIFEGMDGSFVMLLVGCHVVGREKGETWADVGVCTCSEPVDAANNALVDFEALFEIWIVGILIGNGVNGDA